ncbi:hypothetical protein LX77_02714 [Gelidibacter algens]|uniref:Lipoprotein n=1 Tax=Gelidibacter algens TaxID=49280 RepID=A0A1A7R6S8_9FLAO|nr:hypothetical protein [Gelidibacter algens]OBX27203.1 hypothetical protein A9996_00285 [Gelidibacter algens]RAJ22056.1 hypothetical protein LX77_02714 [Gelidibacter algens]
MKTILKTVVLSLFTLSISCKEPQAEAAPLQTEANEKPKIKIEEHCYMYAKNKDTIKLMLKENKTLVTGKMVYNVFEKDASHGSFEGVMRGDTLYADYDFEAEGTTSKGELIFLKKGNSLLQGYGDVEVDAQNTTVFKDNANITFDEQFPLIAVACDKLNH